MGQAPFVSRLDAPLQGKPVSVSSTRVLWEGTDLNSAGAVFLESPLFPWPQPPLPPDDSSTREGYKRWAAFQREAKSLMVSAVSAAAGKARIVNPMKAAHLAVSPAVALDRLGSEGFTVHPWRLEPAMRNGALRDAAGRDLWHSPGRPPLNEPSITFDSFKGDAVSMLVIGGQSIGAGSIGTEAAALAIDAVASLGLDFAAITLLTSPPRILFCEAGPDLAGWDRALEGRVARALAQHLVDITTNLRGDSP
jgi:hypothetical protein